MTKHFSWSQNISKSGTSAGSRISQRGVRQPLRAGGANLLFDHFFFQNCMKRKKFWPREGARPWHPPPFRSASEYILNPKIIPNLPWDLHKIRWDKIRILTGCCRPPSTINVAHIGKYSSLKYEENHTVENIPVQKETCMTSYFTLFT